MTFEDCDAMRASDRLLRKRAGPLAHLVASVSVCGGGENQKFGPFYGHEGEQLGGYHTNPVFPAKAAPTAMERGCAAIRYRRG